MDKSRVLNEGAHEGDWEHIELRLNDQLTQPDIAVYHAHEHAAACDWTHMQQDPNNADPPLVYPGVGGHASYFHPGQYFHDGDPIPDNADGLGLPITPYIDATLTDSSPNWITWPGHWGGTHRTGDPISARSPQGPQEHSDYHNPGQYDRVSDGCTVASNSAFRVGSASRRKRVLRRQRRLTTGPVAAVPTITARRRGKWVTVKYRFSSRQPARSTVLSLTVSGPRRRVPPLGGFFNIRRHRTGTIRVAVPRGRRVTTLQVRSVAPHTRWSRRVRTRLR